MALISRSRLTGCDSYGRVGLDRALAVPDMIPIDHVNPIWDSSTSRGSGDLVAVSFADEERHLAMPGAVEKATLASRAMYAMTVFDPISAIISIPTRYVCNSTNYLPPESSVSKAYGLVAKTRRLGPASTLATNPQLSHRQPLVVSNGFRSSHALTPSPHRISLPSIPEAGRSPLASTLCSPEPLQSAVAPSSQPIVAVNTAASFSEGFEARRLELSSLR